jgi:AraC-like DNA-binding protein
MITTHPDPGYAIDTTWRTLLRDLGLHPADVLRRAGLADDLLEQPSVRLSSENYYRLWNGLERELNDPLLPIRVCEAVRAESFSPVLFAALCSPDFLTAAKRIGQYKALIGPIRFDVSQTEETVSVEMMWPGHTQPPASLVMMELLFCVTLARMGTREPIKPLEIATVAPPEPRETYEAFLGTRIRAASRHRVMVSLADAKRPFLTSNNGLWAAFEPDLRLRLGNLQAGASTAERVRAALLEGLPSGLVSMEAVASRLALSKRTLQRRVEAEGTSFASILAQTREHLARHYLQRTQLPTAEIAFLVGFDEPTSFYRAFRAWTGMTPEGVRRPTSGNA